MATGLESSDAVSSWLDERSEDVWIELGFICVFIDGIEGAFRMIMGTPCLEDSAGEYTVELWPSALKSSSVSRSISAGILE